jgi:hypothetical protein
MFLKKEKIEMEKMFEKGIRLKLRFNFRGMLSIEDLYDLNVKSLDAIYKDLNSTYKTQKEESLLDVKNKEDEILALKIEIIKYIVKTKLEEQEAREKAQENAAQRQKILKVISEKKDKELYDMPIEDLEKMVE